MTDILMMRAALCERYGDASSLRVANVPRPHPGPGEVLVRICASTLDSADRRVRALDMPQGFGPMARLAFGFRRPRQPILGTTLAGIVEAVGAGVTRYREGDAVVASTGASMGCHAEYRIIAESKAIAPKPPGLSFADAAAVIFGGMTARYFLEDKARIEPGQRVLVIGAGGSVGLAILHMAKAAGAVVTACCSGEKADWVTAHGADSVIDYRKTVLTDIHKPAFDMVVDTVGALPVAAMLPLVPPGGRVVALTASLWDLLSMPWQNAVSGRKVIGGVVPDHAEGLARLMALAEAGTIRPGIGATFPLERIGEAHALIDAGHKTGSLVIMMPAASSRA